MDRDSLTGALAELDPAARAVVSRYLRRVSNALQGSRRARADILNEIADGLIQDTAARGNAGLNPLAAAHAAVSGFGDPQALAAGFARELTGRAAHRLGISLVCTGPVVGIVWVAALTTDRTPGPWPTRIAALFGAYWWLPVMLLVVVPAAVVAAAGAGVLSRVTRIGPRVAAAGGVIAALGAVATDAALICAAVVGGAITHGGPLLMVAGGISGLRLVAAAASAWRCARLRSAG